MIVRKTRVQRLFEVLHNFSLILIISMFSTVLMCAYVLGYYFHICFMDTGLQQLYTSNEHDQIH